MVSERLKFLCPNRLFFFSFLLCLITPVPVFNRIIFLTCLKSHQPLYSHQSFSSFQRIAFFMATGKEGLNSDASSYPSTLSNPHASTGSSSQNDAVSLVTSHKFNGHNYLQWSQSVMMYIGGKGKEEYLTGEIETPKPDDPKYKNWKTDNHMIKSWLVSSMNNDIGENFLLYSTAKELWDAVKDSYSSSDNTSELFEIEAALYDLRQENASHTIFQHSYSFLASIRFI